MHNNSSLLYALQCIVSAVLTQSRRRKPPIPGATTYYCVEFNGEQVPYTYYT